MGMNSSTSLRSVLMVRGYGLKPRSVSMTLSISDDVAMVPGGVTCLLAVFWLQEIIITRTMAERNFISSYFLYELSQFNITANVFLPHRNIGHIDFHIDLSGFAALLLLA